MDGLPCVAEEGYLISMRVVVWKLEIFLSRHPRPCNERCDKPHESHNPDQGDENNAYESHCEGERKGQRNPAVVRHVDVFGSFGMCHVVLLTVNEVQVHARPDER